MPLPAGTVTFLFADIEGSTRLLQEVGDQRYAALLHEERSLLRDIVKRHSGHEVDNQGDGFFFAFESAKDGLNAAVVVQHAIAAHLRSHGPAFRVRMGVHTGEALSAGEGYVGRDVHRAARISAAAHGGQIIISEATQILTSDALPTGISLRDLGQHRLKDLTHPERLFQVVIRELPDRFPPLKSLNASQNNLPIQLTRFIGRQHEIKQLRELLSETRLVTLTGPGGSGKTRLALQIAGDLFSRYPHGAWFVDLGTLNDQRLLPHTILRTFGLIEEGIKEPERSLVDFLLEKNTLLILDTCEHVVVACAQLVEVFLRRCKGVQIISTSREPLRVAGELIYYVPPLSIPKTNHSDHAEIVQSEAVQLFIDRANLIHPQIPLSDPVIQSIARICTKLDGLPLAIELSASRVRLMSVEEIEARLVDRFKFLVGGHRADRTRHQTLQAAIDWSYGLLASKERLLLCRLSVFSGWFSLGTAEQVCGIEPLGSDEIFDLLANLVDKSLVDRSEQNGATRFRLLDTVKQYAQAKSARDDSKAVLGRHLKWCQDLAEEAEVGREGPDQRIWLDRLEENIGDLRLGLSTALEAEDEEIALRFVGSFAWYWGLRGSTVEGLRWAEQALARRKQDSRESAKALSWTARYTITFAGDYKRARELAEEGLAAARRTGDSRHEGLCLDILGVVAQQSGDLDRARQLSAEGLEIFQAAGDKWGMIHSLQSLADIGVDAGDHTNAAIYAERSLSLSRELGNKNLASGALMLLGVIALFEPDHDRATAYFRESLRLRREVGTRSHIIRGLLNVALVARLRGDYTEATKVGEEALTLAREWGNKRRILAALDGLAAVFRDQGDIQKTTQLIEERLSIAKELSEEWVFVEVDFDLGFIAFLRGEKERARTHWEKILSATRKRKGGVQTAYRLRALLFLARLSGVEGGTVLAKEALKISFEANRKFNAVTALDVLASLAQANGDLHRATRLYAAADSLHKKWQFPIRPWEKTEYTDALNRLQSEFGQDNFNKAWNDGAEMTMARVIELASN